MPFFFSFFILWPSYHIFASCDYGIYAVISPLFLCLFLERLVCLILNLCHFCVISRWCYRSHHLHPGVLYKRECLLHCHLPRGHHSGHPAPAQHEESGDGGQVRFFCLFCFQRNLTPWCKSDVLRAALLPVISTSDEACTGYQCKIRSAHSERFAIGTVRNFKKLTHLSF